MRFGLIIYIWLALITLTGCSSRYATIKSKLEDSYIEKDLSKASRLLDNSKVYNKQRNAILYNMEKGKLLFLQNKPEESNKYLNKADLLVEDFKKSTSNQFLSYLVNDLMKDYHPKDFEVLGIYYYKALNYLSLHNYESALVEARRMDLFLQSMGDQYKKDKKHYANDAFTNNLMGIIYELSGDVNNAFIAYRNAVDLYLDAGGNLDQDNSYYSVTLPYQLQIDLLRMARANGFMGEFNKYNQLFKISEKELKHNEVIVFWENGLAPVLGFEPINFGILRSDNDSRITFVNDQFRNPLQVDVTENQFNQLANLDLVRINIPTYYQRYPLYSKAELNIDGQTKKLELVENYFSIARQMQKSNFTKELSKSLLRLALKEASKIAITESIKNAEEAKEKKEDEDRRRKIEEAKKEGGNNDNKKDEEEKEASQDDDILRDLPARRKQQSIDFSALAGLAIGIYNYASEQPDTRQWLTLPSEIHYTRISQDQLNKNISLQLSGDHQYFTKTIEAEQQIENNRPFLYFSTQ